MIPQSSKTKLFINYLKSRYDWFRCKQMHNNYAPAQLLIENPNNLIAFYISQQKI